jgi:membrane protease YdiL (CAAX protease family)
VTRTDPPAPPAPPDPEPTPGLKAEPVGLVDPAGTGTVEPAARVGPAGAVGPAEPVGLVDPAGTGAVGPGERVEQAEAVGPAEPVGLVDPAGTGAVGPGERVEQAEAVGPAEPVGPAAPLPRQVLRSEVLLVLGVSVGASALYAALSLLRRLLAPVPLSQTEATLNGSYVPDQPWLDLAFQLAGIGLGVVPALLAVHLLTRDGIPARAIGLDRDRPRGDLARGAVLATIVGVPGLVLYLVAYQLGVSATIVPSALPDVWWRVPVLVLSAVMNATLEEVVVVGYLITRLRQLGWSPRRAVAAAALLRGAYHLYQGFGAFLGNAAMGLFFGWFFLRTRRVMPLIVAHTLLDVAAFVGYTALSGRVSWLP